MTATDHEGFLDAICADPHDVGLRLVYADWLEDVGDTARAEFVRVQCELAELPPYGYFSDNEYCYHDGSLPHSYCLQCQDLRRREGELWLAGRADWGAVLPLVLRPATNELSWWRRGFVEYCETTCPQWLAAGPEAVRAQPVREVKLTDKRPDSYPSWSRPSYHSWLASSLHAAEPSLLPLVLFQALRGGSSALQSGRRDYPLRAAALEDLATAALAWARGPHPERGLTALPPLENPS